MKKCALLCGIGLLSVLFSCNTKTIDKEEQTTYVVTNPIVIDTSVTKEYVSQIRSVRNIEIRALERGFLQQIYVDEGQYVKAGQLLFRIMPKMYEAEFHKSEAEAKAAEIELQNTRLLADKNVVSRNEQAVASARLDQAKAQVTLAKFHLSATEIRAPFDGIIDRIPKKLGSLIDEGELLTSLSDNNQMFAYFNVSEPEYIDYQTNVTNRGDQEISLMLANNQPFNHKGLVEVVEGEFDNETGNIAFRAKFPNPERLLRNGETGKVLLTVPARGAMIIPQKATYEIQDKKYVFVVGEHHIINSREIVVKAELPDLYVVSSGVSASDKILLEGVQKVREGDKISFSYEKPHEVIAHLKLKTE